MSFTLKFYAKKVIVTFSNIVKNLELTNAFIEIIETVSIKKLSFIVFDFTNIHSYSIPDDYMERVKFVTHFSASWNSNIDIIFIATNPDVRHLATAYINHKDNLKWNYYLFKNMETAKKEFTNI